jgi:dephospho-CoA kinase
MVFPKLICLTGYKQVGKDTLADFLVENYGYINMKFATPIKETVKFLFNLTDEDLEEKKELINEKWKVSPRLLTQFVGTEMFQYKLQEIMPHIGRYFWVNKFIEELETIYEKDKNAKVVVSDLRFIHEYEKLKEYMCNDILVITINNNRIIPNDTHISENEFQKIKPDYIIQNNDSINSFKINLCMLFKKFD